MKPLLRIVVGTLAALSGLAFCAVAGIYLLFWSSLPKYDGYLTTTHVKENVTIDRDDLGVPYIKARTRNSVTYGIGFVQGQDRFFQMDLQRRASSGELSALFGKGTLETDKELRIHGFRERAKLVWESLPEKEKQILDLFTLVVNEGLASLVSCQVSNIG